MLGTRHQPARCDCHVYCAGRTQQRRPLVTAAATAAASSPTTAAAVSTSAAATSTATAAPPTIAATPATPPTPPIATATAASGGSLLLYHVNHLVMRAGGQGITGCEPPLRNAGAAESQQGEGRYIRGTRVLWVNEDATYLVRDSKVFDRVATNVALGELPEPLAILSTPRRCRVQPVRQRPETAASSGIQPAGRSVKPRRRRSSTWAVRVTSRRLMFM